jgi:hypothetical protein
MRPVKGGGVTPRSDALIPDTDQMPFGDELRDSTDSLFRVAFVNTGGIPVNKKNGKSIIIEESVRNLGASAVGFQETDVNWNKLPACDRLHERFHGWWRRLSLNIAHYADYQPKTYAQTSAHQFGGVVLCSINDGAARIHSSGSDPTGLGRWAWTRYQGKHGQGLRVVVGY